MKEWAIIFDVDGVLLELTRDEEELFFEPFAAYLDHTKLSRDWNSYAIRNDEDIIREILSARHLPLDLAKKISANYLASLRDKLQQREIISKPIAGALALLNELSPLAQLGIATANFCEAAALRLQQADMWHTVKDCAFGADGGGAKSVILQRAIASLSRPKNRIIFIGDNINDVQAGLQNGVHFIGFSNDEKRLALLAQAGAKSCAKSHDETARIILGIMNNNKIGKTNV